MKCPKCLTYTLEENCPKCNTATIMPRPMKFSLEDKYAKYRRKAKEINVG
jgi:H/ACA ribonucleoprotein complex subunit 3